MDNKVTMHIGGLDYASWEEIQISAGLQRQARSFTLGVTSQRPSSGPVMPPKISQGDLVQVFMGHDLLITGYVFATPVRYDRDTMTFSVVGRSRTADLIDCAAVNTPGQWRNQRVDTIVRAIAGEYEISVVDQAALAVTIDLHSIEPGETAFESIDRLLTLSRLFSSDDEYGRLVIAHPGGAGIAVDSIQLGKNVLKSSSRLNFSGMYSEYIALGQRSATDDDFASASEIQARISDSRVSRRRVKVIRQSGQFSESLARARVEWERAHAAGQALSFEYVIQGWHQSTGDLWRHNMLVRVIDPVMGLDRDMLISEITYELSESTGTISKISVAPPETFLPEPNDAYERRKLEKGGPSDNFEYLIPADYAP